MTDETNSGEWTNASVSLLQWSGQHFVVVITVILIINNVNGNVANMNIYSKKISHKVVTCWKPIIISGLQKQNAENMAYTTVLPWT